MTGSLLLGLGTGLTSALLYGSVFTGSMFAVVLFYLSALPLMLVGLGWGWRTAAIAATAGFIAEVAFFSLELGAFFIITCALPSVFSVYLAMLSRSKENVIEWYQTGRLISWIVSYSCAIAVIAMIAIGPDMESFTANITVVAGELLQVQTSDVVRVEQAEVIIALLTRFLLPATVVAWLVTFLANLWIAGRTIRASDRLTRPWPTLHALQLPQRFVVFTGLCMLASLLPDSPGLVGQACLAACSVAYFLVGLAIIHKLTIGMASRRMLLFILYFLVSSFMFTALFIVLIGVGDHFLNFRMRRHKDSSRPT